LRVGLEIYYGDTPTLCPQNLQLDSAFGTLQVPVQLKNLNARCSWFLSFPLANRIYFSATFRPNSCTAIEIVSPSSGQKVTLNGDSSAWPTTPISFANWEGSAVITAYSVYRYPSCSNADSNKILLNWQALFAESDPAFFGPPSDKISLVNGQFNVTSTLSNVPAPITNSSAPITQFQRRLWMYMDAGQTVTVVAKDTNTGSVLNRLSTAPVPLIMAAKDRIPTTYDNDFHNWPGILSPVRQQLQESLAITAPSAGLYYFSILGGTIFYDSPETVEIYVISGIGTYDNCWDGKSAAIKPLDVFVPGAFTQLQFQVGLPARCRWKLIAPQGTRIAVRTVKQSWGTQLNVWDGVTVLDNRMTSANKQAPAPGGSWESIFLVSSTNYMLIEADQQAKAFNQGFTIEYRAVPHSETQSQGSKPRFIAGGSPAPPVNLFTGVTAQLTAWPYFSSFFYVCPDPSLDPKSAFTININQVDYSVKLYADLGNTNSTYNSHKAYSFSDKVFTAGFSSVMLKVADTGSDGCFDVSVFATTELLGPAGATGPYSLNPVTVSGRFVASTAVPSSWQIANLPVLPHCKRITITPTVPLPADDATTPNIVGLGKFAFTTKGQQAYRIVLSGALNGRLQSLSMRQGVPSSNAAINKYTWESGAGMLYSGNGAYVGRIELPETNATFYGALTMPQQNSGQGPPATPVDIIAIPTSVDEYPVLVPTVISKCNTAADKFCNANFTSSLCIGWGQPSINFRFDVPFDPNDQHDFTFQFLSSQAAGTITALARCDAPPSPTQFDKSLLAVPGVPNKMFLPTICINTTKQSSVYVSLFSSATSSLTLDAAGNLDITVIATETLETLQQQLSAAEEAASKALPQWAVAIIVIFALIAVVAVVVLGFFFKRTRNALEVLQSKAETVMDNRHKKYGQLEDDEAPSAGNASSRELEDVRAQA